MMMDGLCEHLKYNYLTMKIVNQFLFLIISQFFLIQLANCDGDSIFKNTYFVILSQPNKAEFGHELDWIPSDFSIDPQYEFAKALKMRNKDLNLRHDSRFCCASNGINNGGTKECAIFRENGDRNNQTSDEDLMILLLAKNTLFAVKTCEKFHQERLPVIKDTWGQAALQIMYFSEITDPEIGTIQLDGVTNTERGHCHKTMEIIKYFNKEASKNDWKWLVIADDDTILSVNQMLKFLHSFDPNVPVHAGQRYGYGIATGKYGYDYVTGGGGMIFSIEMTRRIVKNLGLCSCPSKDTPDDMHLGMCMSHLGLEIVHSSRFHQARPEDYSQKLLHCQDPISFHKFWNSNPHQVYKKWFESHDQMLKQYKYNQNHRHQEL